MPSASSSSPANPAVPTAAAAVVPLPRRRHPRQVGFSSRTRVYLVPSLTEYTDQELEACFTTEQDTKRNQLDIVTSIRDARTHGPTAEGVYVRGLEYLVNPSAVQERKIAKERHCDAVLDEQDCQWDAGVFPTNWDAIAKVAIANSQESRDRAQMMGTKDAVVARRIRQADDEEEAATISRRRSSVVSLSGTGATNDDDAVATATSTAVAAKLRGHRRSSSASGVPSSSSLESVSSLDKTLERVNIRSDDGQQANQNVAN
jgi:hypothetical protein